MFQVEAKKEYITNLNLSMKFRNYVPHDKQLQEGKLPPPMLPKFEDPVKAAPPPSEKKEDPFVNIAPKKPNWDLWRDMCRRSLISLKDEPRRRFINSCEQERHKALAENGTSVEEDQ
ncbi:hypothetical protein UlMin_039211 [Ulmus minor]